VSVSLTFLGCVMWMACDIFCAPVVRVASGNTVSSGVLRVQSQIVLVKHYKYVWILGVDMEVGCLSESAFMEVNGLQSVCMGHRHITPSQSCVDGNYHRVPILWVILEYEAGRDAKHAIQMAWFLLKIKTFCG
jgi:hypothetical protein